MSSEDGVLFGPNVIEGEPQYSDTDHYTLIAYPAGKEKGSYSIPSKVNGRAVERIWASAFRKCANLTDISIPSSVSEIGGNAFEETGLSKVTIPETVKSVGAGLFENCTSLTDVTLPKTVTDLEMSFFDGCISLQRVKMDNVKTIGMYAFRNCQSLTNLILPEGLTSISSSAAFDKCSNLQRVYIPASVINFPSDSELGAFNIFGEASSDLLVYVVKGSTGEKYAVNNAAGFGWDYKVLGSKSELASVQDGPFFLADMGKKIKVTGTFLMGTSLNVTDITGTEKDTFKTAAAGKAYKAYDIGLLPEGTTAPESMELAVGVPTGIKSQGAALYRMQNGEAVNTKASVVSKTLKTTVDSLGTAAVVGEKDTSVTPDQPVDAESVTLNRNTATVKTGKTVVLTSTVLPENAKDKTITWTSSNEAVATVSSGVVKGIAPGTATITASTVNGKTAECKVTVIDGSEISAVSAAIDVPKKSDTDGTIPFSLVLSDPSRIATISMTFDIDGAAEGFEPAVEGLKGFQALGTKKNDDGSYTAVLSYLEDSKLFSADGKQAIAKIPVKGETPSVTLKDVKISGWKLDEKAAYGTIGNIDTQKKTFKPLSPYDFNEDGTVDKKDLAAAEEYYRIEKTDTAYTKAKIYDVNNDGMIDTEDFVMIQANMD